MARKKIQIIKDCMECKDITTIAGDAMRKPFCQLLGLYLDAPDFMDAILLGIQIVIHADCPLEDALEEERKGE